MAEPVREALDAAPLVGIDQVEGLGHLRCELPDAQLLVQEDRVHVGRPEEVLHVVGHLLELGDLVLVLRVDRVELLVDRLQLLVGAVQLLIGSDQLLVGGVQLLVAGLHLLDGRLEVLLRMAKLELERLDALAGEIVEGSVGGRLGRRLRFRLGFEGDEERVGLAADARDGEGEPDRSFGRLGGHPFIAHDGAGRAVSHALERARQRVLQLAADEIEERERGRALAVVQEAVGAIRRVHQRVVGADHERRRREALQQGLPRAVEDVVGAALHRPGERAELGDGAQLGRQPQLAALAVELPAAVDGAELLRQHPRRLARAQEEHAARLQREVEEREHAPLRLLIEVDQQVAAGDQVELGEGRVAQHVVVREHHRVAELLGHPPAVAVADEVAIPQRRVDVAHGPGVVYAASRHLQRAAVDVRREDPQRGSPTEPAEGLEDRDGDRVGLLPRGACRHPHAQGVAVGQAADQLRQDVALEDLKRVGVPKEAGHPDQEIAIERPALQRIVAQHLEVGVQIGRAGHQEPALEPPPDGVPLVHTEVDAALALEHIEHARQTFALDVGDEGEIVAPGALHVARDGVAHARRRQHQVDHPRVHRAPWHAVEARGRGLLDERQPTAVANGTEPARAVASGARQNHAHRARSRVLRHRAKEAVDRQPQAVVHRALAEQETPARDDHLDLRRHQVDGPRLEHHFVGGPANGQLGVPRQELVHPRLEVRREMLNDHDRRVERGRQARHHFLQRLQAAGRRAEADHGQPGLGFLLIVWRSHDSDSPSPEEPRYSAFRAGRAVGPPVPHECCSIRSSVRMHSRSVPCRRFPCVLGTSTDC